MRLHQVLVLLMSFPIELSRAFRLWNLDLQRTEQTVGKNGNDVQDQEQLLVDRRSWLSRATMSGTSAAVAAATCAMTPAVSNAEITGDSNWPLWPALPVAPYSRRKTLRRQIAPNLWDDFYF